MSIFRDYAPLYWDAGIPAMPLKTRSKAPILSEWTAYGRVMPTQAVRAHWLETYPNSNIGLPFGPASGLCAIDIDTEDEELVEAIMDCLPMSPWTRVGRKGAGLIFKWQGQKNFKVRSDEGMLCEFLGLGNQMVLPPSIHPDTGQPYTSDTNLWEVMDKIQPLGVDIEERLRAALGVKGFTLAHEGRSAPLAVVPQGERDIQLVRHAGYLARVVLGIDKNTKFSLSEAMQHMHTWVEEFTAGAAGDDMDPDKGVAKLLEFLLKDIEGGKTLPEGWDRGLTPEQREHPAIDAMMERNEVQRWTVPKLRIWLEERQAESGSDDGKMLQHVMEVIDLVAKDENFTEFEFRTAVPLFQRAGGDLGLKKTDLLKAYKEAKAGDAEMGADHEAIARQVIDEIGRGGELRHDQGAFWQWNGSCFGRLDDSAIYVHIAEGVKGNVLARRHNDYQALTKTVGILVGKGLVETLETGVNFANGFLDSEGVLHEHSPKFGKTFTMPFNYVPARANEAHKWLEYLESCWGDEPDYNERVMALQEAFAATMFGIAPSYQRAILLHGKAGTGKSTALRVLEAMMPPSAVCNISPETWSERFALSGMVGKTLNVCGELPESAMIDGKAFKEVVEGAQRQTERKNQDGFSFVPIAAHWFASNFLPKSLDTSMGFLRRWLILDFNRIVPKSELIRDFHEILVAEEREAIAAWAVLGLKRLRANKDFTLPSSHHFRLNQVRRANNSVAAWLQSTDKVHRVEGVVADARQCFDEYVFYMKDVSRGYNVTYERFMQMMSELGHECEEYRDPSGPLRFQLKGLEMAKPTLQQKWGRADA